MEYARHNVLLETTQMRDIVSVVDGAGKADHSTTSTATTTTSDSSGQKTTVPQLEKFTELDEDYYTWRDCVFNDLGCTGLGRYILTDDARKLYTGLSESVFYALRSALSGGIADNHAQTMYDYGVVNPRQLWIVLTEYYDTNLNWANINV